MAPRGAGAWLLCGAMMGCGSAATQQPATERRASEEAAAAPAVEASESAPSRAPLPTDIATLLDDAALARLPRRAWVERPAPYRFTREEPAVAPTPSDADDPASRATSPHTVFDVVEQDVRVLHADQGVRILVWASAADLTQVPTEVTAVHASRTSGAPEAGAPGVWLYPGVRLTNTTARGDLLEFRQSMSGVAFRGLVPAASLGAVFTPAAPPAREGEATRLRSDAALRDRPNGRVIAQFSVVTGETPWFEHDVVLLGEERNGHRLVAHAGPSTPAQPASASVERFEVVGWARTRDLGIEPVGEGLTGASGRRGFAADATLLRMTRGTPIRDVANGTIMGVVYEDTVVAADPAPEGHIFRLSSPWGVLTLHTADGVVVASDAP